MVKENKITVIHRKKRSLWADAWVRMRRNWSAVLGMIIFGAILIACFSAPLFLDYQADVIEPNLDAVRQQPSFEHIFGTDTLGRDIFNRMLWGGRVSLSIAILSTIVSSVLGIVIGAVAGYAGGKTDSLIMRFMDVFMAIPSMLLMITLVSIMKPNIPNLVIAMSVGGVPGISRIVRGQMLSVMRNEYVEAVHGMGAGPVRIVFRHCLPNALSPLISQIVASVGGSVMSISALSFLGIGVQAPAPEWGAILSAGRGFIRELPYMTTIPGLTIAVTILSLTLMGDGLRDALDPRMKR